MYWANLLHIYQPPEQKKEIIDQVVKESYNKILAILKSNSKTKISLNICASLTEQLNKYGYHNVINNINELVQKGQIELLGSAAYHPILPLLPNTEIVRQIRLNEDINHKYFGKSWEHRPKGFFLPEMAYSKKVGLIIQSIGYKWIVLDEVAYCEQSKNKQKSSHNLLSHKQNRQAGCYNGGLRQVSFNKYYKIKNLKIVFRNRRMSMLFFGKWLDSTDKFFSAIKKDNRSSKFLITAFDGENIGHHYKHLAFLWQKILNNSTIHTLTYSEYLDMLKYSPFIKVNPLASSWSTEKEDLEKRIPYPLWKDTHNKLHQYQWQITNLFVKLINKCQNNINYKKARSILDKALSSDQYWWASSRPWWGPSMIKQGLYRFLKIMRLLKNNISFKKQAKIKELSQKILQKIK